MHIATAGTYRHVNEKSALLDDELPTVHPIVATLLISVSVCPIIFVELYSVSSVVPDAVPLINVTDEPDTIFQAVNVSCSTIPAFAVGIPMVLRQLVDIYPLDASSPVGDKADTIVPVDPVSAVPPQTLAAPPAGNGENVQLASHPV